MRTKAVGGALKPPKKVRENMEAIKTFDYDSREFQKLNMVAEIMTYISGNKHRVDDVFYDFGASMMWTTILSEVHGLKNINWCQALSPAEQMTVLRAESIDDLVETAKWILEKKEEAYRNHLMQ